NFIVNIYGHDAASSGPGTLLFTQSVQNVQPLRTGLGDASGRDIYEFHLTLPSGFQAQAGHRYWLSPLGNTAGFTWSWKFHTASGERRSRPSAGAAWSTFTGDLAFEFCGN